MSWAPGLSICLMRIIKGLKMRLNVNTLCRLLGWQKRRKIWRTNLLSFKSNWTKLVILAWHTFPHLCHLIKSIDWSPLQANTAKSAAETARDEAQAAAAKAAEDSKAAEAAKAAADAKAAEDAKAAADAAAAEAAKAAETAKAAEAAKP